MTPRVGVFPRLTLGVEGEVRVVDLVRRRVLVHQRAQQPAVDVAGRAARAVGEPAPVGHTARAQVPPDEKGTVTNWLAPDDGRGGVTDDSPTKTT